MSLHPEVLQDPRALRWVVTSCPWDLELAAAHPDGPLGELLADGTLVRAAGGPGWIETAVADPADWRAAGGLVRRAVERTAQEIQCQRAEQPLVRGASCALPDHELRALAERVLAESIAPLAGAHGGMIRLDEVRDGVVHVDLSGACRGCAAAAFTLQQRFAGLLQRQAPGAVVTDR